MDGGVDLSGGSEEERRAFGDSEERKKKKLTLEGTANLRSTLENHLEVYTSMEITHLSNRHI